MKLINYKLQTQIEYLSDKKSHSHFKEYLQELIEDTSKPYYQRADYIGLSLQELKLKIDTLTTNISELQQLKKNLAASLDIAKEITAEIFMNNGVDRIDGNIISSLTLSKPTTKTKQILSIKNDNKVMELGYVKFEPDLKAIEDALKTKEGQEELKDLVSLSSITTTTLSKVKVNCKKIVIEDTQTEELITLKKIAA